MGKSIVLSSTKASDQHGWVNVDRFIFFSEIYFIIYIYIYIYSIYT